MLNRNSHNQKTSITYFLSNVESGLEEMTGKQKGNCLGRKDHRKQTKCTTEGSVAMYYRST